MKSTTETNPAAVSSSHERSRVIRVVRVEASTRTIITLFAVLLGIWLLARLLPVLLVLVVALMLVGTLAPPVRWLENHGISRGVGIALVFAALFTVMALLAIFTVPELLDQISGLIEREPEMRTRLADWLAGSSLTSSLASSVRHVHYDALLKSSSALLLTYSANFLEILAYGVGAIFLALYIMMDRDRLRGALFAVVPRTYHVRLSRILGNLEVIVGGYIRGQVITCTMMAIFMFILLYACGIPNALAIAIFGGLADVLPYIGIFLSMGPAVAAALPFGAVTTIVVFALMLVYEEIESRLLVPVVYGRALRLPSSVVMFSLIAGATLFGILGALLALPLSAAILMLIEELRVELPGEIEQAEDIEIKRQDALREREYLRRTKGVPAEAAAAIAVQITEERKNMDKANERS